MDYNFGGETARKSQHTCLDAQDDESMKKNELIISEEEEQSVRARQGARLSSLEDVTEIQGDSPKAATAAKTLERAFEKSRFNKGFSSDKKPTRSSGLGSGTLDGDILGQMLFRKNIKI